MAIKLKGIPDAQFDFDAAYAEGGFVGWYGLSANTTEHCVEEWRWEMTWPKGAVSEWLRNPVSPDEPWLGAGCRV